MDDKPKFKFRKYPKFIYLLDAKSQTNKSSDVNFKNLTKSVKIFGFKLGNVFASFWLGILLFGFQSYFLRQNLRLTDNKFISD